MTIEDHSHASEDKRLERLGYKPQFPRLLGLFADFSLGYSYMSPMSGIVVLFAYAITTAGPAFFWTLPVVLLGQLLVCLVFAEASSAFPIAGGVCQWARQIGGLRWGFLTSWVYLLALVATIAGLATGSAPFLVNLLGIELTPALSQVAIFGFVLLAALANLAGTRVLAKATEAGVWAGLLGLLICGVYLLLFSRVQPFSVLFSMAGHGDDGAFQPMLLASLIGIWIFFGFEACGDLAEEVKGASSTVPRAMILTVVCGGASTFLIVLGILLAQPDLAGAANGTVADPVNAALVQGGGAIGSKLALACILVINLSAGASIMASTSRLLFSLARDRFVIGHGALSRLDARGVPVAAIVTTTILIVLVLAISFLSSDALTKIVSVATAGIYLSFQMVVLACLLAGLRGWRPDGSFTLRAWGLPVRVVALAFGVGAILNLVWPRAPEAGWFANWFSIIALAIVLLVGLAQIAVFVPRGTPLPNRMAAE